MMFGQDLALDLRAVDRRAGGARDRRDGADVVEVRVREQDRLELDAELVDRAEQLVGLLARVDHQRRSAPSRRSRKQFSCTGPTVNIRTSISVSASVAAALALLAVVDQAGRSVHQRRVEERTPSRRAQRGVVLASSPSSPKRANRNSITPPKPAFRPARLPARRLHRRAAWRAAALPRFAGAAPSRRLARPAARLDGAGGVSTVLVAALALRLGHGASESTRGRARARSAAAPARTPASGRWPGSRRTPPRAPARPARRAGPARGGAIASTTWRGLVARWSSMFVETWTAPLLRSPRPSARTDGRPSAAPSRIAAAIRRASSSVAGRSRR